MTVIILDSNYKKLIDLLENRQVINNIHNEASIDANVAHVRMFASSIYQTTSNNKTANEQKPVEAHPQFSFPSTTHEHHAHGAYYSHTSDHYSF